MIEALNIVFAILFLGSAIYLWKKTSKLTKDISIEEVRSDRALIKLSVPKNNDRGPQSAEQLFSAMHGIFKNNSSLQPSVSFEIISRKKKIMFFVSCPIELKEFVVSQVYSQYPHVNIEIIDSKNDYSLDFEGEIAATELALKKPTTFPIKTFQNFEVDPLASITGVMGSISDKEEIWAQVIIRPIDDDWQEKGIEQIKNIKEPPPKHVSFFTLVVQEIKVWIIDAVKLIFTNTTSTTEEKKKQDAKELPGPVLQALKGIEEKITKLGFDTTIRIVSIAPSETSAQTKLEQIVGAFKQFNTVNQNSFVSKDIIKDSSIITLYQAREIGNPEIILNVTELASVYHFPSEFVTTPTIEWSGSKKGEPPANLPILGDVPSDELTIIAKTNFRNQVQKFGMKKLDRRLHMYVIGKTGTGKSTFMENMIYDDIREGRGVAIVDPHGETVQHVLDFIPEDRIQDVVYFNPSDSEHPIGFNILENVSPEHKNIISSGVVGVFKKIFGESWGPRLEYILRNVVLALLETPNSTLLGVMRILTDNSYRRLVVNNITDPVIKDFFVNEFEKYDAKFRQEAIAPIQNKVGQFLSSSVIRNIVGQPKSSLRISEIMDDGKILLADLSTGKIGEDNSALLGSMLITKIQLSAMQRAYLKEDQRRDFYLYVDEFQNFATDSFATILSEARKYHLNLVMTNQYISQLSEAVAGAIFGNVGTMVAFRVGATDAQTLQKEFEPIFDANDLINQPNRQIYIKMAIDGVTVPAFSAATLPPPAEKHNLSSTVIEKSRLNFGVKKEDVEEYIAEWSTPIILNQNDSKDSEKKDPQEKKSEVTAEISKVGDSSIKNNLPTLPENKKIQILKDRFDRPWYAISDLSTETETTQSTNQNNIKHKGPDSQSGGEREKDDDHLITWVKADELGLQLDKTNKKDSSKKTDFLPIDEI